MITHFIIKRVASYTQTIYVSQPSTLRSFTEVERTIRDAVDKLTPYYRSNSLRANPDKTQVTAFHVRNKEANRSLKVVWNKTELENTPHPKYLGVTLDRTLGYKQHIHNTKMKVATRNNPLRKLSNSKWGANAGTIRIRGTCMGEITSRPETEYGTKQCMQSRHRMHETNQCRRPVFAIWNCATRHPDRCMCWNREDETGNQCGPLSIWRTPCRDEAEVQDLLLA